MFLHKPSAASMAPGERLGYFTLQEELSHAEANGHIAELQADWSVMRAAERAFLRQNSRRRLQFSAICVQLLASQHSGGSRPFIRTVMAAFAGHDT